MSVAESSKRRYRKTSGNTMAALGIWCAIHKDDLSGKPLNVVAGRIRKQFSGEPVSDLSIKAALDAAGVLTVRSKCVSGTNRRNQTRALAAIVDRLVDSIERSIGAQSGTLLGEQDRAALALIRSGKFVGADGNG